MSPLHAVRAEIDSVSPTVLRLQIIFPNYIVASDYILKLDGTINLATTPTPTNGDLSTTLVGNRIVSYGVLPFPPNALAMLLPLSLLQTFSNAISDGIIYFRPIESYLTNSDGSVVEMSLTPLPIDVVHYGLILFASIRNISMVLSL